MSKILEKLTKEDLINVIAHMHDVIQDWTYGYGFSEKQSGTIEKIGNACVDSCNWDFPEV